MTEQWEPVPEWEGVYEVSSLGRVRRILPCKGTHPGRLLKQFANPGGYPTVSLSKNNKSASCMVHRAVAIAFHGPPPSPGSEVNHLNGDKGDNRAMNLEWSTRADNAAHAARLGLMATGSDHGNSRLSEDDVRAIKERLAAGEMQKEIAADYGVHKGTVWDIAHGKTWGSVA